VGESFWSDSIKMKYGNPEWVKKSGSLAVMATFSGTTMF
jgi:hypothetical protein